MKTIIVKAAIKYKNKIYSGLRHGLIMQEIAKETDWGSSDEPVDPRNQGFLTNKGKFVSREEAAKIAFSAGQIGSGINSLDSYQVFPVISLFEEPK
jgi:hypothetical protein